MNSDPFSPFSVFVICLDMQTAPLLRLQYVTAVVRFMKQEASLKCVVDTCVGVSRLTPNGYVWKAIQVVKLVAKILHDSRMDWSARYDVMSMREEAMGLHPLTDSRCVRPKKESLYRQTLDGWRQDVGG